MDREKVGERIRKLRTERGLTQEKLAEQIGVARGSVARYEAGTYYPSQEVIVKLAAILGVTTDLILGNTMDKLSVPSDDDIKFALFGVDPANITDAQFEEVKRFAQYIRDQKSKPSGK